jgi:hypothetical protein
VGRPAYGGAHDTASTTSPHDTASTMSEYEQAIQHGKAERHNGEKPREAASGKANGEEAGRGSGGAVSSEDGGRHLVCVGRPAVGGAHDKASPTSPPDTASTMSKYEQAPRSGKRKG